MASRDEDFLKRLIATFRTEAWEHLAAISAGLTELETATEEGRSRTIESIFRETHSLKGAARTVNLSGIERLCQSMENVLAAAKRGEIVLPPESVDILLSAVDRLREMLNADSGDQPALSAAEDVNLIRALDELLAPGASTQVSAAGIPGELRGTIERKAGADLEPPTASESVRVPIVRLESILHGAETLRIGRNSIQALRSGIESAVVECARWRRDWAGLYPAMRKLARGLEDQHDPISASNRVDKRVVPVPANRAQVRRLFEFLDRHETALASLEGDLRSLLRLASRTSHTIVSSADLLLSESVGTLMLPVSYLTDAFPAFVRRIAREQSKEAELKLAGTDVELDRRVLQEIKDPIVHLLRNCVDHGLEKPAERTSSGKPPRGTVSLSFAPINSGKIEVRVSDDGKGIDTVKVRKAAEDLGLVSADAASPTDQQDLQSLIFHSGFTTSPIVTELSGRGIGLAIVREKVEGVGGVVSVESTTGRGTTFRLELPVTMSTFRGVLVRCGESVFVVPTINVERVAAVARESVKTMENQPTVLYDEQTVALSSLSAVLGVPRDAAEKNRSESLTTIVLHSSGERIAFEVDEVIDEQEVLEKSLGSHLERLRNISGAAVTATGRVVPVLNASDLVTAALSGGPAADFHAEERTAKEARNASILVVEDSITARSLMKNILEGVGFRVEVAVDGVDGFTKLKEGAFDLVVSDVEMPRMNGFDLTAKIRGDRKLADLPVVLVTALGSQRDRERGIDVGANAYIVKSSFENSNLIEIVERLV